MAEKNVFQQAKDAINQLVNRQGNATESDQEAARQAIEAAYMEASPEEQQQLRELEQHLKQNNHLQ